MILISKRGKGTQRRNWMRAGTSAWSTDQDLDSLFLLMGYHLLERTTVREEGSDLVDQRLFSFSL